MPIIDQWQKDSQRYQQQTLRFDPTSGRIRVPSHEEADAFHEYRYRRNVELLDIKINEAPKMRTTAYDAYTREGFRETPASSAMTLRELKVHLPDFTWDKLKDIVVLRQSHEDRLGEIAAEVERYEDIAKVSVVVMAVDAAMQAHPEADEDRAGMQDLEAMFSRILETSQAAHGATGDMRLAVEVPDPFLDCVDTDDDGTLLHGASCVELPVHRVDTWQCCPHDLRGTLNFACANPGWDAQREQLTKQRPQGFDPAVEQEALASYEGRRGGGAITSDMLDIRNQQLLQLLRTALQHAKRCVRRFEATARLPWVDYTHLDLTRVFAAAVQSVYGLSLPRASVPPLFSPSAEPQASIHPRDVVQHGVKPLETRRQLAATSLELQQVREVQRSAYPDYPEYDRLSAFYVDCKLTIIVIGGVRFLMALLDTGCDYSGVHQRVVDRMKPGEVDATLHLMSMQGIGGKMEMHRLVGRVSYVINSNTD
eukprot:jgi/Tetstr1/456205/TSEL_042973.t1